MGKRLENISGVGKEILKNLKSGSYRGSTIKEIQQILKEEEQDYSLKEINEGLKELIEYGSVRGEVGSNNERKYSLSGWFGSGNRDQRVLLGKPDVIQDTYKLIKRLFSGVLILFGLGLIAYSNIPLSGNVIATTGSIETSMVIAFATLGIGGLLLLNSFKK